MTHWRSRRVTCLIHSQAPTSFGFFPFLVECPVSGTHSGHCKKGEKCYSHAVNLKVDKRFADFHICDQSHPHPPLVSTLHPTTPSSTLNLHTTSSHTLTHPQSPHYVHPHPHPSSVSTLHPPTHPSSVSTLH